MMPLLHRETVETAVTLLVAVAAAAFLLFAAVPEAVRGTTSLLMAGSVFAAFASREGFFWTRVRVAVASAMNLALLTLWNASDASDADAKKHGPRGWRAGGGGDGDGDGDDDAAFRESSASSVLLWTRGLPASLSQSTYVDRKVGRIASRHGDRETDTDADPERDRQLAQARSRMMRASAREAALLQMESAKSKESAIGGRILMMPIVLGAAAIVPIVIASRMLGRPGGGPTAADEGFFAEDEKTDASGQQTAEESSRRRWRLAKALLVSIAATALIAAMIRRGDLVLSWVLTVALLVLFHC
jgi:hypothetical protein